MEVRIESMICVWDDAIPTLFLEFVESPHSQRVRRD